MDLVFNDEQRFIREEARRFLADKSASERVRQTVNAGTGFDAGLWSAIAGELGWCAMAVPEAHDGLGLGKTELAILMEAAGERLAAVPLWSTICAGVPLLLAVASDEARQHYLPRIAAGEIAVAVAWGNAGAVDPLSATAVVAEATEAGYRLGGRVAQVIDLEAADVVLVPARLGEDLALFALERDAGHEVRRLETLDGTRQIGELTMRGLAVCAQSRLDGGAYTGRDVAGAVATAQLGLAAEQVGAARGVMDVTLAYVAERVQFGRTIASFQAVKHRCARLEVDLAEARALVYGAAATLEAGLGAETAREVSAARALASDLLFRASEEAIQLHGGVGFTWEYDPHLYFKRAQAACSLLGSPEDHLAVIAAGMFEEGAAA
ncbi:acyl-CoA dehydrogenase family protein [Oricola sp.]|uniref:acyl-CoA dehydrogenase family protein n=1 Tax=Oricola sp. TaxID=1979950 RepID=UPI0025EA3636|nr:acyl-CoA dehydrogenase family protein [Oricola sp.]MCI5074470.1 acyl-CoA/acyl-ACP dehydrogenase [Oricola sp.]